MELNTSMWPIQSKKRSNYTLAHNPNEGQIQLGFKIPAESSTARPSCIHLDADCDESDTKYILYLDSALNWLDSDDSTDILS